MIKFKNKYNRGITISAIIFLLIFLSFTATAQQPTPPRKTLNLPNGAKPIPKGKYEPNWDSIKKNYKTPDWFSDAKFGIMMHWGLYAVPAYQSEWYPMHMYSTNGIIKYHREKFGLQEKFGYKDFIPSFTAENFNPAQWAELFKKSGAKYVIPTAEHHDGFALYDSDLTKWDAKDMAPKRDLIGDLGKAVRKIGLKYGVSNHRMEHWSFMYPKDANLKTDLFDPEYADFYGPPQKPQADDDYMAGKASFSKEFLEEWLRRCQELVDKYQPDILLFDNGVNDRGLDPVKLRLAAYYYNSAEKWKKQVSLTTKSDAYLHGSIKDYERQSRAPKEITDYPWQVDDPVLNRFGYTEGSAITNVGTVVNRLIENVSKNGALLLNISPKADGTLPENQQNLLLEIGKWLDANGEGIYGTRTWTKFGEGENNEQKFRFTVKKDALYAYAMNRKGAGLLIKSLSLKAGKVKSVSLLGNKSKLEFSQNENGLSIKLQNDALGNLPVGLKIEGLKIK